MNINKIKQYMETCPFLRGGKVNVNCLSGNLMSYSIEFVEHDPVIKKYCDGGTLRQFRFIFAMRAPYDENFSEDAGIRQRFFDIELWIRNQDRNKWLPDINDAMTTAQSIEVASTGYVYDSSMDSMKLQMEIVLVYMQKELSPGMYIEDLEGKEEII